MIVLLSLLLGFGAIIALITYLTRRNKKEEQEIKVEFSEECCGAHEVCDKDSLLVSTDVVEYFDDEELDALAGTDPLNYTDKQLELINDVFVTLKEQEVAAWLRSLQIRRITLPVDVREQALMIVSERRHAS